MYIFTFLYGNMKIINSLWIFSLKIVKISINYGNIKIKKSLFIFSLFFMEILFNTSLMHIFVFDMEIWKSALLYEYFYFCVWKYENHQKLMHVLSIFYGHMKIRNCFSHIFTNIYENMKISNCFSIFSFYIEMWKSAIFQAYLHLFICKYENCNCFCISSIFYMEKWKSAIVLAYLHFLYGNMKISNFL